MDFSGNWSQTAEILRGTHIVWPPIVSFMNSFNGETEFGKIRALQK